MPKYAVKNIEPNPFRHIERYPIQPAKVTALRESLQTTGFWGNVVARPHNGKVEIAYGHHRLAALKEEYGPNHKIELIVRELPDEVMLQIMARENMEEWGTSASVEQETVRAVVEAYAEDQIGLPPPTGTKTQTRYAPSFIPGDPDRADGAHPYTAQTVAEFLGWVKPTGKAQDKVAAALTALQYIEEGLLTEDDFVGLGTKQAAAVIEEARKARARREVTARLHRQQAEEARRAAEAAARDSERAEREQQRREQEAKRARNTAARRKAEREAQRLAEERRRAAEAQKAAEKRREAELRREQKQQEAGRKSAKTVGRTVSAELKKGKVGYKQAADIAARVDPREAGPPPHIEDFARRLAGDLNKVLDPDRDPRAERLSALVEYRDHLEDHTREDLARTIEGTANRLLDFAGKLRGQGRRGKPRALPAGSKRR
ncbi:MAG: ParB/RepB/Spo0J family partition protein [Actinomycetota bacterium]